MQRFAVDKHGIFEPLPEGQVLADDQVEMFPTEESLRGIVENQAPEALKIGSVGEFLVAVYNNTVPGRVKPVKKFENYGIGFAWTAEALAIGELPDTRSEAKKAAEAKRQERLDKKAERDKAKQVKADAKQAKVAAREAKRLQKEEDVAKKLERKQLREAKKAAKAAGTAARREGAATARAREYKDQDKPSAAKALALLRRNGATHEALAGHMGWAMPSARFFTGAVGRGEFGPKVKLTINKETKPWVYHVNAMEA